MIRRSVPHPDLGWGVTLAVVIAGLLAPALPAFALLWVWQPDLQTIRDDAPVLVRGLWFVASGLALAPMSFWIAVPVAAPLVRAVARRGWAGPGTIVGLGLGVGVPIVHWLFNGDLTVEAPEMIPVVMLVLVLQAMSVWVSLYLVLQRVRRRKASAEA